MTEQRDPIAEAIKYAQSIERAENLSPLERRVIALAREVRRLQREVRQRARALR